MLKRSLRFKVKNKLSNLKTLLHRKKRKIPQKKTRRKYLVAIRPLSRTHAMLWTHRMTSFLELSSKLKITKVTIIRNTSLNTTNCAILLLSSCRSRLEKHTACNRLTSRKISISNQSIISYPDVQFLCLPIF